MVLRILAVVVAVVATAGAGLLVAQTPPEGASTPPSPAAEVAATPAPAPAATEPAARPRRTATPTPPPAVATPQPALPPSTSFPRVTRRLDRLVSRNPISGVVALAVYDDESRPVYTYEASRSLLPASTQKLPVAAAALVRLGPEFRYTTAVATTTPARPNGVVDGDLVIVGGGDPALAGPDFARVEPERPRTPMETLAQRVRQAGIRRVRGRIIGDPSVFAHEPVAAGWPSRYFSSLDATPISGLTVDAGRRITRSGSGLRAVAAQDPAHEAARVFRRLLRQQGVRVDGAARAVRQSPVTTTEVAHVQSDTMETLLTYMVQRSDNHLADTIFRTVGLHAGDSTWIGSAGATAETLAPLQLSWEGVVLADGSGLSRSNRVSADFLAQLQARMALSNVQQQWFALLAVSGQSGTLRHRMLGTVAEKRVYAKTGSLRDVASLVGTVAGTRQRRLHFAVVGNQLASTSALRELADRAAVAMAEELHDCRRVRPPPGNRKKPRPVRLVCG
ncbi:MAG TPA: D-alanyl-D-alanine carboxypeptidase/D-alanyl-D-alanine-endopeptidase [Egibacteraceae bacterium]|nr:D-alanyl-D-alanine carboxypeptidase/D-alanyl-D-alanine-endopeptidase [Egibacteraceae bacterium]